MICVFDFPNQWVTAAFEQIQAAAQWYSCSPQYLIMSEPVTWQLAALIMSEQTGPCDTGGYEAGNIMIDGRTADRRRWALN